MPPLHDLCAWAGRTRLDVHHVGKRAQRGSDFDLDRLVALCPPCHAQTDAPYRQGRLVITPLGQSRFTFEVIRGADKWATQAETGAGAEEEPGQAGGAGADRGGNSNEPTNEGQR